MEKPHASIAGMGFCHHCILRQETCFILTYHFFIGAIGTRFLLEVIAP